jgi:putative sigma-54 modulation protein
MNYNSKGTEVTVTAEVREYLEKKLARLEKFLQNTNAARADIELQYLSAEAKMYRVEIMLYEPSLQSPLRAEARGGTLYEAIDIAAGELFTELTRTKKKRLHNLRHSAVRVKEFLRGWRDKI